MKRKGDATKCPMFSGKVSKIPEQIELGNLKKIAARPDLAENLAGCDEKGVEYYMRRKLGASYFAHIERKLKSIQLPVTFTATSYDMTMVSHIQSGPQLQSILEDRGVQWKNSLPPELQQYFQLLRQLKHTSKRTKAGTVSLPERDVLPALLTGWRTMPILGFMYTHERFNHENKIQLYQKTPKGRQFIVPRCLNQSAIVGVQYQGDRADMIVHYISNGLPILDPKNNYGFTDQFLRSLQVDLSMKSKMLYNDSPGFDQRIYGCAMYPFLGKALEQYMKMMRGQYNKMPSLKTSNTFPTKGGWKFFGGDIFKNFGK